MTQVTATVRNPADPDRAWEGRFLVDTGAIDCLAPRDQLEALGLAPKGERVYALADGSEVWMQITTAEIELMGEVVGATIVFGDADVEPLLGVTALNSAGIEVDPHNQTLTRLPSIRLKGLQDEETGRSSSNPISIGVEMMPFSTRSSPLGSNPTRA